MADISISDITNKYESLDHTWTKSHSFIAGESLVRTMTDSDDSSNNSASTEWVNRFFENRIPTTPTINVPLLTPMWFDHELNSNAWVKSDYTRNDDNDWGWLYASETKNSDIYAHLVLDVNGKSNTSETVGDNTVTFIRADDGHKIIVSSNPVNLDDTVFNDTGVSWYYVLDTTNKRFKLPRNRYGFQGIKSDNTNEYAGMYDSPGLPKPSITSTDSGHTHKYNMHNNRNMTESGSNEGRGMNGSTSYETTSGYANITSTVDDDSIYKSTNTTVQSPATEMFLYFSTGDENSSSVGGGGVGGGVIDGTLCKEAETVTVTVSTDKTIITDFYTTKNDCWLYIESEDKNNTTGFRFYIDGNPVGTAINEQSGQNEIYGVSIPVKKGNVIRIGSAGYNYREQTFNFTVYEYKLNSLAPQIAMPDWDTSKKTVISNGDTVSENGWIYIDDSNLDSYNVMVNGVIVFNSVYHYDSTRSSGSSTSIVPVSKGDKITYSANVAVSRVPNIFFYPCKTVEQTNPPVYITKREYGNYATVFDENTTYAVGDYVKTTTDGTKYYRITKAGKNSDVTKLGTLVDVTDVPTWCYTLYSDGYCEQSGKVFVADTDLIFKKTYVDTSYICLGTPCINSVTGEYAGVRFYNFTTTGVHLHCEYTTAASWEAKGYIY